MKYFVFSDIHSFYDELIDALNEAGFEKDNPEHCIISCGDLMDRGRKSLECLKFVNSLPDDRKILIRGNHESLLQECLDRGYCYSYDIRNGTNWTIADLGYYDTITDPDEVFKEARKNPEWIKYKNSLVDYYETDKYIFCHSWIPLICNDDLPKYYIRDRKFKFNPDWKNASFEDWETARWGNPFDLAAQGLNQMEKTIIFGHFHTSWAWSRDSVGSEWGEDACFDPYYGDNIIGIDACTAYSGKVNILVLED